MELRTVDVELANDGDTVPQQMVYICFRAAAGRSTPTVERRCSGSRSVTLEGGSQCKGASTEVSYA
jgi:hypothetical protein